MVKWTLSSESQCSIRLVEWGSSSEAIWYSRYSTHPITVSPSLLLVVIVGSHRMWTVRTRPFAFTPSTTTPQHPI